MPRFLVFNYPGDDAQSESGWEQFFAEAGRSGMFNGGSALGSRSGMNAHGVVPVIANRVSGYFMFTADSRAAVEALMALNPVVISGGSVDIIELVKDE